MNVKNIMHKHLIPIYDEMLYITFSREAMFNKFDFEQDEGLYESCGGLAFKDVDHRDRRVLCLFVEPQGDWLDPTLVAHESYHIADLLFDIKGVEYCSGSGNEHMAYLLDHIMKAVLDAFMAED